MNNKRGSETRVRLLAVERMICKIPQTVTQIIDRLECEYDITADRKTIYQDIAALTLFIPIIYVTNKGYVISEVTK